MDMSSKKSLVSVIILNFNSGDYLLNCVKSVTESNYKNVEIIVVDNASKDESHRRCKSVFPEIVLIENNKNVGFCEGNNIGLKKANGKFVVVLNPDTKVEPNLLDDLLLAYQKNGEGLYQPKIMFMDKPNIINTAGNMTQIFGLGYSRGAGEVDNGQYDNSTQINFVSGACFLTSIEIIKKIGFFNSSLFMTHDDHELGWRAAQIGIKSYLVPQATAYHLGGHVFKWNRMRYYYLERNRQYVLLTLYSRKTFFKILPQLILVDLTILLFYLMKGHILQKISGYFYILRNWKDISKRYREIQNKRIVSDSELIKTFDDEISLPIGVGNSSTNKMVNSFIGFLSKSAKKTI